MAKNQEAHRWLVDDDIVAFYLYKFGDEGLTYKKKEIAELMLRREKNSAGTLNYRMSNFKYLDTNGREGASHYARQSKRVYEDYKNTPQDEFCAKVMEILKSME